MYIYIYIYTYVLPLDGKGPPPMKMLTGGSNGDPRHENNVMYMKNSLGWLRLGRLKISLLN